MSQLFTWGGQSIGVSASASVLPMNTQDWSPLGWTGWISLQSKGLKRVFSSTTAAAAKSRQSCLTLCDPIDGSPTGSSVPGILQARTLEWVAISFSNHESEKWKWSPLRAYKNTFQDKDSFLRGVLMPTVHSCFDAYSQICHQSLVLCLKQTSLIYSLLFVTNEVSSQQRTISRHHQSITAITLSVTFLQILSPRWHQGFLPDLTF